MWYILWIAFLVWAMVWIGQFIIMPWLNKNVYSHIWSEPRPKVARETLERIKELCIDGDVPEETAILMAAQENNTSKEEILASFNADDAAELVKILSGKKPNFAHLLLKQFAKINKNTKRR